MDLSSQKGRENRKVYILFLFFVQSKNSEKIKIVNKVSTLHKLRVILLTLFYFISAFISILYGPCLVPFCTDFNTNKNYGVIFRKFGKKMCSSKRVGDLTLL